MIEIKVEGRTTVKLRRCSKEALDSLGTLDILRVNGGLSFRNCSGLASLPDGLMVNGNLNLDHCIRLTGLPGGLKVDGHLSLWDCKGLTKLPDDLHVGEEIFYDSDTGFYGRVHVPGVIPKHLKRKLYKF